MCRVYRVYSVRQLGLEDFVFRLKSCRLLSEDVEH